MDYIETPLCEIAYRWGTDKCPKLKHPYTPFYYELFKDRKDEIRKVLELGIGYYKTMAHVERHWDDKLQRVYHTGASLKMWRDFFPNAQVFGADIEPDCMFTDERIQTFVVDETKKEELEELIRKTGSGLDIFIDDGSHRSQHQIFVAKTLMPLLSKDCIYIIEDVRFPRTVRKGLSNYEVKDWD